MMNFVPLQEKRNNVLVIGRDFNAQLGQDNENKFAYHKEANRN